MRFAAFVFLAVISSAQTTAPRFSDYPPIGVYNGKNAPVVINTDNRDFRTRLRRAGGEKPNFAAHYILTAWGCGAECLAGAVIDANSGITVFLPGTLCCWSLEVEKPIVFHLDSRLIQLIGVRNEQAGDDGSHYYEFRNGRFLHIKSIPNPIPRIP